MKLIKTLSLLIVILTLSLSCQSEKKKDSQEEVNTTEEAVSTDQAEESAEVPASAEEAQEAPAETQAEEAPASKSITVVYPKDEEMEQEVKDGLALWIKENPSIKEHFHSEYGFAFFPKITKGGLGIGGAGGHGLVFEDKEVIGSSSLAQATFGLQAGGQQYMEVIFFEDKEAMDRFKGGKLKFSGQASAVALKEGASADLAYQDGVAIFTKVKGGLMAEASIGGQKFKFKEGVK